MTKPSLQSGAPLLSRFNSILAVLPKRAEPILGEFSPDRGSNNGSPPPPSLNHKGVTGVHHEGTRDTSGGRGVLWFLSFFWNFKQPGEEGEGGRQKIDVKSAAWCQTPLKPQPLFVLYRKN